MNDTPQRSPISPRASWSYMLFSSGAFALAVLLPSIALYFALKQGIERFIKLGLLQPLIAALLAFAIVVGARLTRGRYVNERRKGATSASSATIAVRLWAICFALLAGTMLLFAILAQSPEGLFKRTGLPKSVETQIEVKSAGAAPAVTSVKVTQ